MGLMLNHNVLTFQNTELQFCTEARETSGDILLQVKYLFKTNFLHTKIKDSKKDSKLITDALR